ncbi:MAG: S1 RNA-binding domain-containing protein [Nitrososphaerales archaeon]|jgi:translation initiation factor 2 subunit 1|nr:S1 RNA-binding domain-containing protein [Nitrososphaerales archaeon]
MIEEIPELGEFVLATVKQITTYGVYVSLDEYNGMKGFLHRSEVATGRIRRIGRFIRVGQKEVLKVIRVNRERREINLSLKQITKQEKKDKLIAVKHYDKAQSIIEMTRNGLKLSQSESDNYQSILENHFDTLYKAMEDLSREGSKVISDLGLPKTYIEYIEGIAKEKISPPKVSITSILEVSSPLPNGIDIVKDALSSAEKKATFNTAIMINYLSAPKYRLEVEASDYKEAEKVIKSVVDVVQNKMKKRGTFQFIRNKR